MRESAAGNSLVHSFCARLLRLKPRGCTTFLRLLAVLALFAQAAFAVPMAKTPRYLSPTALAATRDGQTLFVAGRTGDCVLRFDTRREKVTGKLAMPAAATGLALSADQQTLYVTCAAPESQVCLVNVPRWKIIARIPAGHTANSPVLSPDGKTLYVCNEFNNDISVIDLATRREVRRIPVQREPIAADVTPDGKFLLVANHLSVQPSDTQFVSAAISVIDLAADKVVKELSLVSGSEMLKALKVSPDGKYAVVTHIYCNYDLPTTHLDYGWVNANALTIIDLSNLEIRYTLLLDEPKRGAATPWGVAWSADSRTLAVAHAGTHEVSVIDFPALLAGLPTGDRKVAYHNYRNNAVLTFVPHYEDEEGNDGLPFLTGARARIPLATNDLGPRAIVMAGRRIYTANYLSDTLGEIDLAAKPRRARSFPLGPKEKLTPARQGEIYFNDARLCPQEWQSCASCHPGDARVDALNWDLINDGIGNYRNTRSLLNAAQVGSEMAAAGRPALLEGIRAGFEFTDFTNQPPAVVNAIAAYVKSLQPVPSPELVRGKLSAAARRGQAVFYEAGCGDCHVPGLYSDQGSHHTGTGAPIDGPDPKFYTPSLLEAWRTAPYLHNGAAATIRDVLTTRNPRDGRHGDVADLTAQQIDDLCAFVRSL